MKTVDAFAEDTYRYLNFNEIPDFIDAADFDLDQEAEDDTLADLWECGDAPETPPEGYTYAPCPPLETEEEQRALCGPAPHPET